MELSILGLHLEFCFCDLPGTLIPISLALGEQFCLTQNHVWLFLSRLNDHFTVRGFLGGMCLLERVLTSD